MTFCNSCCLPLSPCPSPLTPFALAFLLSLQIAGTQLSLLFSLPTFFSFFFFPGILCIPLLSLHRPLSSPRHTSSLLSLFFFPSLLFVSTPLFCLSPLQRAPSPLLCSTESLFSWSILLPSTLLFSFFFPDLCDPCLSKYIYSPSFSRLSILCIPCSTCRCHCPILFSTPFFFVHRFFPFSRPTHA